MTRVTWDKDGERRYETGVDRGVLYKRSNAGQYPLGVPWNGLTTVTESPSGAESNAQYADNMKYLNLKSAEEFGFTIEAFTYPDEFEECDGTAQPAPGVFFTAQRRRSFGFSYRSLVGDDIQGTDKGYKIHLVYGAEANPSEKARATVNDSPEAAGFSWECTTTKVAVGNIDGVDYKPTSHIVVDSTKVSASALSALEDILYGTAGADPRLPMPGEVVELFSGTLSVVETVAPSYDAATDTVTVPTVTGVVYELDGEPVSGSFTITKDTVVTARPAPGYRFTQESDSDWSVNYS